MPGLFDIVHPFFGDSSDTEKLLCCQKGENVIDHGIRGNIFQNGGGVEVAGVFVFDGHDVVGCHFELDELLDWVVFQELTGIYVYY